MCSSDASVIEDKNIKFQFGIVQMSISMYFAGLLPKIERKIGTPNPFGLSARFTLNPMFTLGWRERSQTSIWEYGFLWMFLEPFPFKFALLDETTRCRGLESLWLWSQLCMYLGSHDGCRPFMCFCWFGNGCVWKQGMVPRNCNFKGDNGDKPWYFGAPYFQTTQISNNHDVPII